MPIFRVKSVKIYTGQKKFTRVYPWLPWQIWGMGRHKKIWIMIYAFIIFHANINYKSCTNICNFNISICQQGRPVRDREGDLWEERFQRETKLKLDVHCAIWSEHSAICTVHLYSAMCIVHLYSAMSTIHCVHWATGNGQYTMGNWQ